MCILLSGTLRSFLQLIGVLIIFLFVLLLTYLTTRWMGTYQKGMTFHKNLRVIETIGVGNNKMISIVAAGTKYLVVAVGKEEIRLLAELTEEELSDLSFMEERGKGTGAEGFADIMEKLKGRLPKSGTDKRD